MSDKQIKIILLGESGVGKTNLINAFLGFEFEEMSPSNISSICYEGKYEYNNKSYIYTIWDTAGQEKYRSINKIYIRDAKIILIVYSIVSRHSFNEVDFWINHVKENKSDDEYIMALVANKIDLFEEQVVIDEEGEEAAEKYGIEFLTTSALTGAKSFKNFVNKLIACYIQKFGKHFFDEQNNNIKINKTNNELQASKKCC